MIHGQRVEPSEALLDNLVWATRDPAPRATEGHSEGYVACVVETVKPDILSSE